MEFSNLLVSTDLSEPAEQAFHLAATEARLHNAKVRLVYVIEHFRYPLYTEIRYHDQIEKYNIESEIAAHSKLNDYVEKYFKGIDVAVDVLTQKDSVGEDLASFAKEQNCDGIIISTAGKGYVGRVLLGSTVLRVLQSAQCPVVVVPHKSDTN